MATSEAHLLSRGARCVAMLVQRPCVLNLDGPGHVDVVVAFPPFDDEVAAVEFKRRQTVGQTATGAGHEGGAGAGATGLVRPAPRSHTRRRIWSRAFTWAKPTLTASGNRGWCSIREPSRVTST